MNKLLLTTLLSSSLLLSACGDNVESKVMEVAAEKINTPLCINAYKDQSTIRYDGNFVLGALISEEYIDPVKEEDGYDFVMQSGRNFYDLNFRREFYKFTDKGDALIEDKKICYAERKATEVVDLSDEYSESGTTYINAEVAYETEITADFIDDVVDEYEDNASFQRSFEQFKENEIKSGTVKYKFKQHDEDGWVC